LVKHKEYKPNHSDIKKGVTDYLKYGGWFVFYVQQGPLSYKGITDIIACRNSITIYVEIKTETDVLNHHQVKFRDNILLSGCLHVVARSINDIDRFVTDNFGENNLLL